MLFEVRVAKDEERGRDPLPPARCEGIGRQQVARDLFAEELVERPVGVEGFDDVIAVTPSLLEDHAAQGQRLGEPRDVEPMASPTLAEPRRGKPAIDQFFISVGRRVVHERGDFLGRRRQAEQIEREPRERGSIGIARGLQVFRLPRGLNESIYIIEWPSGVANRRHRRDGRGD